MQEDNQDVIFTIKTGLKGSAGIITLNRPKALNALNHNMIQSISDKLLKWQHDDKINLVIIRSNHERAFCAGGDVKSLYLNGRTNTLQCMQFFYDEYRLNTLIKHYPKPYIALINGITMGGGIGISLHGSHIVAAQDLALAMPESSIGFFTDVGASYFLSRCPFYSGYYMGLTGDKINCHDAKFIGLINYIINNDNYSLIFEQIIEELTNENYSDISEILSKYSADINTDHHHNKITNNLNNIRNIFNAPDLCELLSSLKNANNQWAQNILALLNTKSPTSLLLIFELLNRGAELDFNQCMQMEYAVAYGCLNNHDFYEGVRALLIDKDNKPNWNYLTVNNTEKFNYSEYFNQSKAEELKLDDLYS